jgi:transcriptional regulator with GAF, ATPase, and Fis domain
MERYSILDSAVSLGISSPTKSDEETPQAATDLDPDLEAGLKLLAERARYLTGASSVSIGLHSGADIVCRASAGPEAPVVGSSFARDSRLLREVLRLRQILQCDDVPTDTAQSENRRGLRSVMVAPLVRRGEVIGAFELIAEQDHSFEEQDVTTIQRLSELVVVAVRNQDVTARRLQHRFESDSSKAAAPEKSKCETEASRNSNVQTCQACGFPVSHKRTLCLDCEEAQLREGLPPSELAELAKVRRSGWLKSHAYTMGTLAIAVLTAALLLLKFR